jgi:bifunctional DNA-binding transcriptional regulator/antitoxin component of YhaV-PrlF toxin-antitoxin module
MLKERTHGPFLGETTITGRNQVTLPARATRIMGWDRGDHLLVGRVQDDILLLMRRPENWVDAFAGRLSHVFGSHEETRAYLERERASWDTPRE